MCLRESYIFALQKKYYIPVKDLINTVINVLINVLINVSLSSGFRIALHSITFLFLLDWIGFLH